MEIKNLQALLPRLAQPTGPGFFAYDDVDTQTFAFGWANADGEVGLISKPYRRADSRDRTLEKVKAGGYPINQETHEDGVVVQLLSKGKQLLAVSPTLSGEAAATSIEQGIQRAWQGEEAATTTKAPLPTNRRSFQLTFYRSGPSEPWQGVLAYPTAGEKTQLKGGNLASAQAFVHRHLYEANNSAEASAENTWQANWDTQAQTVPKGKLLNVTWTATIPARYPLLETQLMARSLGTGEQTLIGRHRSPYEEGQPIRLKGFTEDLLPGLYRISASLDTPDNDGDPLATTERLLMLV